MEFSKTIKDEGTSDKRENDCNPHVEPETFKISMNSSLQQSIFNEIMTNKNSHLNGNIKVFHELSVVDSGVKNVKHCVIYGLLRSINFRL